MLVQGLEDQKLCSQRDPTKEAAQWLELQVVSAGHLWILGLGAGYHVAAMAQKYPEHVISVVDHRPELRAHFEKSFPACARQVRVELVATEKELLDCQSYRLFGPALSSIHRFRPAISMEQEMYAEFSKALRGQTKASFRFLCEQLEIPFNEVCFAGISDFQIKEIALAVEAQGPSAARRWVRVLRELVT